MPFLEVHDHEHDHDSFAERLDEHPAVASLVTIERADGRGTYAVEWDEGPRPFCRALSEHAGTISRAARNGDRWEFDLLFLSEEALAAFRERLDEAGIDLDVRRISRTDRPGVDGRDRLSPAQRETLDLALAQGYYSIPRRTTTQELGDQLGISDQAVIERLRRTMTKLGEAYLEADLDRPGS